MARDTKIGVVIYCEKDLLVLNSQRILVEEIENCTYKITSYLKLDKPEIPQFIERLIQRNLGSSTWFRGLVQKASKNDGYLFFEEGQS